MRARRVNQRGQTVVEVALILPIFVLLLVGIFDLGRAVYATSTINNAAREAGRLAIVDQTLSQIKAEAVKQSVALGLTPADIAIDFRDPSTPNTANSCPVITIGCVAHVTVKQDGDHAIEGYDVVALQLRGLFRKGAIQEFVHAPNLFGSFPFSVETRMVLIHPVQVPVARSSGHPQSQAEWSVPPDGHT